MGRMRKMRKTALFFFFIFVFIFASFFILLSPSPASAQQAAPHFIFKRLSIEQGLSQNSINCIIQDRAGFMWFGTETGLNRFDGYSFKIFLPRESDQKALSNGWINALLEDHHGSIWVGTENGLNQFIPSREQFVHYFHNPDDPNSLSSNRIFCIYEDRAGNLWIGTDAGLNFFDRSNNRFIRYQPDLSRPETTLSHKAVRTIIEDGDGSLWIGTYGGGLDRLEPKTGRISHYRHDPANPTSGLPDDYIMTLAIEPEASSGNNSRHSRYLWIGTNSGGLVRLDPKTATFKVYHHDPSAPNSLSHDSVFSLAFDQAGQLWIGTYNGGLNCFDPATEAFVIYRNRPSDPFSLSDNRVVSLFFSADGILWVGTYTGVNQLNLNQRKFLRFLSEPSDPASLSYPEVRAICYSRSRVLWVGTDGGGLDGFDQAHFRRFHYRYTPGQPGGLSSNRVFSVVEDRNGSLWIGTYDGGLNHLDPATGRITYYRHNPLDPTSLSDNRLRPLLLDSRGRLWVGTDGGGLNLFDPKTRKFKIYRFDPGNPQTISSDRIFSIAEDGRGTIWIGAYGGGLCALNPETDSITRFSYDPKNPPSLSSNYIINVSVAHDGSVWVGTNGGGLSHLNPATGTFTRYTEAKGLPSSAVYAVLEDDDGKIWFSSNHGLSRLDPATGTIKNFDISDGLQSYEFNGGAGHKNRRGWLYFGGINGFNAFNPKEIRDNQNIPPVVLTDFQIANVSVRPGQSLDGQVILERSITQTRSLELSWKQRKIAFEFAALDYTCPEKNQYAYLLEGFEKEWNYVGTRRFASYSNLPPGQYVFRVKASNNDGYWNEAGTAITIRIIPPFWRTWWFYALVVLLGVGVIYGGFRYRLAQVKRRQEELERLVVRRTKELSVANRKLELLATTDELTGVANYRRFREFLEYERKRAARSKKPISLLIADLDDFKNYNDTYGHQAGDECLRKVARLMVECCRRPGDLVCRYGGDEFAVVLAETDLVGAHTVAERIRERVEQLVLGEPGVSGLAEAEVSVSRAAGDLTARWVTICIGCATMNPAEGHGPDEQIAAADRALYKAKSSGKNQTSL